MYSNKVNLDFSILSLEIDGNKDINNIIENKLNRYFDSKSSRKYKIKINSNYKKISASKDSTGNTTNFKLSTSLNLYYEIIDSKGKKQNKSVSFSENFIIKRNENNYEQNNYEKIVIRNMSELMIEKMILYLSRK